GVARSGAREPRPGDDALHHRGDSPEPRAAVARCLSAALDAPQRAGPSAPLRPPPGRLVRWVVLRSTARTRLPGMLGSGSAQLEGGQQPRQLPQIVDHVLRCAAGSDLSAGMDALRTVDLDADPAPRIGRHEVLGRIIADIDETITPPTKLPFHLLVGQ